MGQRHFRELCKPDNTNRGVYFTKRHPHKHYHEVRPVFPIKVIQEVKWNILQGCVDMIPQHKDTKYLSVRESHMGQNESKMKHGFGYDQIIPNKN